MGEEKQTVNDAAEKMEGAGEKQTGMSKTFENTEESKQDIDKEGQKGEPTANNKEVEPYLENDLVFQKCLEEIEDIFSKDSLFVWMIEQELRVSWKKKEKHKKEYFSTTNIWLEFIVEGMSKIASSVLSLSIAATIFDFFKNGIIDFKIKLIITGIMIAFLIGSAYVIGKYKSHYRNEDRETWVRHSVYFYKLRYLIIKFVEENDQSNESIQKLKKEVFELANGNLDQFKSNMMTQK